MLAWMSQCPQLQQRSSTLVTNDSIRSCFLSGLLLYAPVRTCGWGPLAKYYKFSQEKVPPYGAIYDLQG